MSKAHLIYATLIVIGSVGVSLWATGSQAILVASAGMTSARTGAILEFTLDQENESKKLPAWTLEDLFRLKQVERKTGSSVYRGVLFSKMMEKLLEKVPVREKALIDLIVFEMAGGKVQPVPRSFLRRYPVILAHTLNEGKLAEAEGLLRLVLPWNTHGGRLKREVVPLERFTVRSITAMRLTSYEKYFGKGIFLKKRTDPFLLLGEKRFVQNCMTCHHQKPFSNWNVLTKSLRPRYRIPKLHKKVGVKEMPGRDQEALIRYVFAAEKQGRQLAVQR